MKRLVALLLLLLAGQASAEAFFASVDRTRLNEGETVVLTLESTDPTRFGRPDFSPLNAQFEILGSRQVNRLTSLGDTPRATTRWILTLQPKASGEVVIPPIRLEDAETLPITLLIEAAGERGNGEKLAPVFIDASLDQDSIYVQAQTVLTLRIYHSVSMYDDSSLTPLQMDDARVEQLGEPRTYEKNIGGVRHGVIELQYAIYPQRSGELSIPGQVFSATLVDRSRGDDFLPFGPRAGKVTRVKSPDIPLQVKPKPAAFPADAPWLMAVAASTHDRNFVNALVDMAGGAAAAPADIGGKSVTSGYGPAQIVYAAGYVNSLGQPDNGQCLNPFPAGTFNGEIVVCDRGGSETVGRVAKGQNVKDGGAGGYILANTAADGDSLVGDAHVLPGVHITYEDGVVLKAWLAGGSAHTATILGSTADTRPANGDSMASFSSRGPNPSVPDLLKPDVTAPGVDIFAAFHTPAGSLGGPAEYGMISGTSMSSPHAAGAAALSSRANHSKSGMDEMR